MRRLIWSPGARDDLIDIQTYIAGFNPAAASRFFTRLTTAGKSLLELPDRGRPIGNGRRELTVVPPYLIRYVVLDAEVRILSVRHVARRREP
ncbi:type II toxin-antitoxin system RelE/ParE family toxin [uncultured Brevundimonas sp.]|uniref:type II toxin-antitoxin system RelE/ParE family toxin n=1 Tax=uncultured Brevundimonas sp. TaxID=213418 RepID=UPI0030EB5809|tara:strand:- start:2057 stop:2332 length:276 start_codon:yes stop_codon:yes gene_type:complete